MRVSARLVGLDPNTAPATEADITDYYRSVRPELRLTRVARRNVGYGFWPPMPFWVQAATPARPAWIGLMTLAAAMLPRWTRRLYGLPGLPTTDLAASLNGRVLRSFAGRLPQAHNPAHQAAQIRVA